MAASRGGRASTGGWALHSAVRRWSPCLLHHSQSQIDIESKDALHALPLITTLLFHQMANTQETTNHVLPSGPPQDPCPARQVVREQLLLEGELRPFHTVVLRLACGDETAIAPALERVAHEFSSKVAIGSYPVGSPVGCLSQPGATWPVLWSTGGRGSVVSYGGIWSHICQERAFDGYLLVRFRRFPPRWHGAMPRAPAPSPFLCLLAPLEERLCLRPKHVGVGCR